MSDNNVTSVGRVELDLVNRLQPRQEVPQEVASNPTKEPPVQENAAVQAEAQPKVKDEKPANPMADISLKFKIDAETNDVTIFILNRASQEVVRTIPPEDMNKLNPGELLELFA